MSCYVINSLLEKPGQNNNVECTIAANLTTIVPTKTKIANSIRNSLLINYRQGHLKSPWVLKEKSCQNQFQI